MRNPFRRKPQDLGGEGAWSQRLDPPVTGARITYHTPRRVKLFRVMAVLVWPLAIMLVIGWIGSVGATDHESGHAGLARRSPTRAQATVALQDWLDQKPSPLPGGHIVTWNKASVLQQAKTDDPSGDDVPRLDVHRFTVAARSGLYTASLTIASTPDGDWQMVGKPGLTAHRRPEEGQLADGGSGISTWPGLETASIPGPVSAAIQSWAQAVAGGTSSQLRQAVGDPNTTHIYTPVDHARVSQINLHDAAGRWSTAQKRRGDTDEETPAALVVRVSLRMHWNTNTTNKDTDDNNDKDSRATGGSGDDNKDSGDEGDGGRSDWGFDVLVTDANTASPHVVAWGGPGTGTDLTPYQNAHPHPSTNTDDSDDSGSDGSGSDGSGDAGVGETDTSQKPSPPPITGQSPPASTQPKQSPQPGKPTTSKQPTPGEHTTGGPR